MIILWGGIQNWYKDHCDSHEHSSLGFAGIFTHCSVLLVVHPSPLVVHAQRLIYRECEMQDEYLCEEVYVVEIVLGRSGYWLRYHHGCPNQ